MSEYIQSLITALEVAENRANNASSEHADHAWLEYEAARRRLDNAIREEKQKRGVPVRVLEGCLN